ncbi:unnamed protein product [Trichogramma brassicae]|uniref:Uncharacterized protein n=1 Tax=Trichogramma brassicae TaxID=86971 RepID=A0A6H5IMU1_9HYME|nr:unnamed protein product [Trichogramma brassicae]
MPIKSYLNNTVCTKKKSISNHNIHTKINAVTFISTRNEPITMRFLEPDGSDSQSKSSKLDSNGKEIIAIITFTELATWLRDDFISFFLFFEFHVRSGTSTSGATRIDCRVRCRRCVYYRAGCCSHTMVRAIYALICGRERRGCRLALSTSKRLSVSKSTEARRLCILLQQIIDEFTLGILLTCNVTLRELMMICILRCFYKGSENTIQILEQTENLNSQRVVEDKLQLRQYIVECYDVIVQSAVDIQVHLVSVSNALGKKGCVCAVHRTRETCCAYKAHHRLCTLASTPKPRGSLRLYLVFSRFGQRQESSNFRTTGMKNVGASTTTLTTCVWTPECAVLESLSSREDHREVFSCLMDGCEQLQLSLAPCTERPPVCASSHTRDDYKKWTKSVRPVYACTASGLRGRPNAFNRSRHILRVTDTRLCLCGRQLQGSHRGVLPDTSAGCRPRQRARVEDRKIELERLERLIFLAAQRQIVRGDDLDTGRKSPALGSARGTGTAPPQSEIDRLEEIFVKLRNATGVSQTSQVLDRFLAQRATREKLKRMQTSTEAEKVQLEKHRQQLTAEIEMLKFAETKDADQLVYMIMQLPSLWKRGNLFRHFLQKCR